MSTSPATPDGSLEGGRRGPARPTLRERAHALRADTYALYLAMRDPRVPWYAKVVLAAVVAYALSPIDLIPDFIPVIGFLDDLVIVPAGIALAARLIPRGILDEHRARARELFASGGPKSRVGAVVVVAVWAALVWLVVRWIVRARTVTSSASV
jgi:uncharacterized membrane protein YkvA (DUF1232 family)